MNSPELSLLRPDTGPRLRLARLWWAVGIAMMSYIVVSCLEPARYVPDLHLWDKLEHASAFFGMTLWFGGLTRRSRYPVIGVLMALLGGGIEIAQGAMHWGRDADIMDFVADSVGIVLALITLYLGVGGWASWIERLIWPARDR